MDRITHWSPRRQAMRWYRSQRNVLVLAAPAAALPKTAVS